MRTRGRTDWKSAASPGLGSTLPEEGVVATRWKTAAPGLPRPELVCSRWTQETLPGVQAQPRKASGVGAREEVGALVASCTCTAGPSGVQRKRGTPCGTPCPWEDHERQVSGQDRQQEAWSTVSVLKRSQEGDAGPQQSCRATEGLSFLGPRLGLLLGPRSRMLTRPPPPAVSPQFPLLTELPAPTGRDPLTGTVLLQNVCGG